MSIAVISDIHVKVPGDKGYQVLLSFLDDERVKSCEKIFLLGDIFDVMSGGHHEYIEKYSEYFSRLKTLASVGKEIYYFEGNHDMHLQKLYHLALKENSKNFHLLKKPFKLNYLGKRIYFSHGDELYASLSYQFYKKLITSAFARILANYIVPYRVIDQMGTKASQKSRKRNKPDQEMQIKIRDGYRKAASNIAKKKIDMVICGHCHVKDHFKWKSFGIERHYLNVGFPVTDQSFILFNEQGIKLESLQIS